MEEEFRHVQRWSAVSTGMGDRLQAGTPVSFLSYCFNCLHDMFLL